MIPLVRVHGVTENTRHLRLRRGDPMIFYRNEGQRLTYGKMTPRADFTSFHSIENQSGQLLNSEHKTQIGDSSDGHSFIIRWAMYTPVQHVGSTATPDISILFFPSSVPFDAQS